ncbi:MAG: dihydrodipicolinate synthase family protein, partial [Candidatus Rokubacteria bacterium]|nr:dihydrodipicolinate synthase family protein [Candidatus Rokubacteria bacterium]
EEPPTPTKLTALRRLPGGERLGVFGGMNAMYFLEELGRGAIGVMTGFAFPDILVEVYERFRRGDAAGAAAVYDRYASFIRYEGQQGLALAFRKEVLRRRGAIRTAFVRPPGPVLDDVTRAELAATLEPLGLAAQLAR